MTPEDRTWIRDQGKVEYAKSPVKDGPNQRERTRFRLWKRGVEDNLDVLFPSASPMLLSPRVDFVQNLAFSQDPVLNVLLECLQNLKNPAKCMFYMRELGETGSRIRFVSHFSFPYTLLFLMSS
jgi:hypothetical protein